ncbi:MAG: FAD-dependent oxidoreductase [Spirochaetales bacterium]|nr:FAD-dependent oxidoreductase [Spirochaetales bacterium]
MHHLETDVLIIGGGASGVAAAISACRARRRVVVVEATPWLGGMITAAGVSAFDGNYNLPSGVWGELRRRLCDYYGGDEALATGWISRTACEPHIAQRILREMAWEAASGDVVEIEGHTNRMDAVFGRPARLTLLLRWRAVRALRSGTRIAGAAAGPVASSGDSVPGGALQVRAAVTIAADEYGDFLSAAGVATRCGLESREVTGERWASEAPYERPQDLTYVATLSVGGARAEKDDTAEPLPSFPGILDGGRISWNRFFDYATLPGGLFMLNWPIHGNDYFADYLADGADRRRILRSAKEKTLSLIAELRLRFPRRTIEIAHGVYPTDDGLPPAPYIREARRIIGRRLLTLEHIAEPYGDCGGDLIDEAIAVGDYPVDHHRREDSHASPISFPSIPAFSVPLGCLIPDGVDGLIAAEKSISVSGLANGATRLQPVALLVGQAAGALAAVCVERGVGPDAVPHREVQARLLREGAMLLPYRDAPPSHPFFAALQWAGVLGYLNGEGRSAGWANEMLVHGDAPYRPDSAARAAALREIARSPRRLLAQAGSFEAREMVRLIGVPALGDTLRAFPTSGALRREQYALAAVLRHRAEV